MCAVSTNPEKVSSGEASAIQSERSPARKRDGAPRRQLDGARAAKIDPAAQINQRRQQQREGRDRRNRPGAQRGLIDRLHEPSAIAGRRRTFLLSDDCLSGVAGGRMAGGMQRFQERNQGGHFGRIQVLAIGWHVAAALNDLTHQLIAGEPGGDAIQGRAALASGAADGMAVAALLHLEDQRALPLQRRSVH